MVMGESGGFKLDDGDQLPWLEPAEEIVDESMVSPARIGVLVVIGLLLLGIIVGGGYWLKHRPAGAGEEARLIPAQGGDYKIPAGEGSAKTFKGEGDTSYATSEGVDTDGKVDASRMPESPMEGVSRGSIAKEDAPRADVASTRPAAEVSATVKDETKHAAAAQSASGTPGGGAMVQLGAYGSEAVAREGWTKLSKRFDYLAPLSSTIEKATVGGSTVYRLRAGAGTAANASNLCGRLKVAGENCIVVK